MRKRSCALYQVSAQGTVIFSNCENPFSDTAYSLFKYGSRQETVKFANALVAYARIVVAEEDEPWLLTSAAYKHIPTAAATLTHFFWDASGIVFEPLRVKRENLFAGEYEKLDAAARHAVLMDAGFHLQGPDVKGRKVVVIDDIRITGTHETLLTSLLQQAGAAEVLFLYIVRVEAAASVLDPTLEHRLNSAAIASPQDLLRYIHAASPMLNARLCKRILLWPAADALPRILRELPDAFLAELAEAVAREGYDTLARLQPAVAMLQAEASTRVSVVA